jgi:hypothetical protein
MPKHQWKNGVKTIYHDTQTIEQRCGCIRECTYKAGVELPTIKYLRRGAADVEITNAHLSTRARIHAAQSVVEGATVAKTLSNGLPTFSTTVSYKYGSRNYRGDIMSLVSVLLHWLCVSIRNDTAPSDIEGRRVSRARILFV